MVSLASVITIISSLKTLAKRPDHSINCLLALTTDSLRKGGHLKLEWTQEHRDCFELLKCICTKTPILAYADYSKPFIMHTDASGIGLGAILYQEQAEGPPRVITYASQSLSKAEKKYHSSKLEFLALKWDIMEQFHEYLYGGTFEVHSDNNPLTYVLTMAKLDATGQRWVTALANYHFKITYHSGKQNIDADAPSHIPWEMEQVDTTLQRGMCDISHIPMALVVGMHSLKPEILPKLTKQDWMREQATDANLNKVIQLVISGKHMRYKCVGADSHEVKLLMWFHNNLVLKDGLLYCKVKLKCHDQPILQFMVSIMFRAQTITSMHDELGHMGMDHMLSLLQDRFFWYQIAEDVRRTIRSCDRCLHFKTRPEKEELNLIETTYPMELVHLDYLTIGEKESDKIINILVVTDHFTKYAQAYIMPSQTAHVTAKVLWEQFLVNYGWPTKILMDQG